MKGNSSSLISSATAKEESLLTHPRLAAKFLLLELPNPTTLCLLQQEIPPSLCQHQSSAGSASPCSATKGTETFCGPGSVTSIIPVLHSTFSLRLVNSSQSAQHLQIQQNKRGDVVDGKQGFSGNRAKHAHGPLNLLQADTSSVAGDFKITQEIGPTDQRTRKQPQKQP